MQSRQIMAFWDATIRHRPAHPYAAKLTPSGFVVYACMILVLLYAAVKYQIESHSAVGTFLHKPGGVVIRDTQFPAEACCQVISRVCSGLPDWS